MGFDDAIAFTEGRFHRLGHPAQLGIRPDDQAVDDQLDVVPLLPVQVKVSRLLQHHDLAVDPDADETGLARGLKYVFMLAFLAADLGRHQRDPAALFQTHDCVHDLGDGLPFDGAAALGAVGPAHSGEKKTQIVVDLRYCAHRGTGVVGNPFLVDGDGRREALDVVDVGLVHPAQELAGVGRERLDVAALALCVDGVESQGTLAGSGYSGDHHQLFAGDGDLYVLEVVFARAFDVDKFLGHTAPL